MNRLEHVPIEDIIFRLELGIRTELELDIWTETGI